MIFPNLLGLLCIKFFQSSMSYYSSDFLEKENDLHMKTKHVTYEQDVFLLESFIQSYSENENLKKKSAGLKFGGHYFLFLVRFLPVKITTCIGEKVEVDPAATQLFLYLFTVKQKTFIHSYESCFMYIYVSQFDEKLWVVAEMMGFLLTF